MVLKMVGSGTFLSSICSSSRSYLILSHLRKWLANVLCVERVSCPGPAEYVVIRPVFRPISEMILITLDSIAFLCYKVAFYLFSGCL
jgi:hypothetical protein